MENYSYNLFDFELEDLQPTTFRPTDNSSCQRCSQMNQEVEALRRQEEANKKNYLFLKKKIISTDLLLRHFTDKTNECRLQEKQIEEWVRKYEKSQRDVTLLDAQLKKAMEEIEPMKMKCTELQGKITLIEEEKRRIQSHLNDAEFKNSQYERHISNIEVSKNIKEEASAEGKRQPSQLESKIKKQRCKVDKLQTENKALKVEITKQTRKEQRLLKKVKRLETFFTKHLDLMVEKDVMTAKAKDKAIASVRRLDQVQDTDEEESARGDDDGGEDDNLSEFSDLDEKDWETMEDDNPDKKEEINASVHSTTDSHKLAESTSEGEKSMNTIQSSSCNAVRQQGLQPRKRKQVDMKQRALAIVDMVDYDNFLVDKQMSSIISDSSLKCQMSMLSSHSASSSQPVTQFDKLSPVNGQERGIAVCSAHSAASESDSITAASQSVDRKDSSLPEALARLLPVPTDTIDSMRDLHNETPLSPTLEDFKCSDDESVSAGEDKANQETLGSGFDISTQKACKVKKDLIHNQSLQTRCITQNKLDQESLDSNKFSSPALDTGQISSAVRSTGSSNVSACPTYVNRQSSQSKEELGQKGNNFYCDITKTESCKSSQPTRRITRRMSSQRASLDEATDKISVQFNPMGEHSIDNGDGMTCAGLGIDSCMTDKETPIPGQVTQVNECESAYKSDSANPELTSVKVDRKRAAAVPETQLRSKVTRQSSLRLISSECEWDISPQKRKESDNKEDLLDSFLFESDTEKENDQPVSETVPPIQHGVAHSENVIHSVDMAQSQFKSPNLALCRKNTSDKVVSTCKEGKTEFPVHGKTDHASNNVHSVKASVEDNTLKSSLQDDLVLSSSESESDHKSSSETENSEIVQATVEKMPRAQRPQNVRDESRDVEGKLCDTTDGESRVCHKDMAAKLGDRPLVTHSSAVAQGCLRTESQSSEFGSKSACHESKKVLNVAAVSLSDSDSQGEDTSDLSFSDSSLPSEKPSRGGNERSAKGGGKFISRGKLDVLQSKARNDKKCSTFLQQKSQKIGNESTEHSTTVDLRNAVESVRNKTLLKSAKLKVPSPPVIPMCDNGQDESSRDSSLPIGSLPCKKKVPIIVESDSGDENDTKTVAKGKKFSRQLRKPATRNGKNSVYQKTKKTPAFVESNSSDSDEDVDRRRVKRIRLSPKSVNCRSTVSVTVDPEIKSSKLTPPRSNVADLSACVVESSLDSGYSTSSYYLQMRQTGDVSHVQNVKPDNCRSGKTRPHSEGFDVSCLSLDNHHESASKESRKRDCVEEEELPRSVNGVSEVQATKATVSEIESSVSNTQQQDFTQSSVSNTQQQDFTQSSVSHTQQDFTQSSVSHTQQDFTQSSVSHTQQQDFTQSSVSHTQQQDFTQSSVSHTQQQDFTQSSVSHTQQQDFTQSSVLHTQQQDFTQSSVTHTQQQDFTQSSVSHTQQQDFTQSSVLHTQQQDFTQSSVLHTQQQDFTQKNKCGFDSIDSTDNTQNSAGSDCSVSTDNSRASFVAVGMAYHLHLDHQYSKGSLMEQDLTTVSSSAADSVLQMSAGDEVSVAVDGEDSLIRDSDCVSVAPSLQQLQQECAQGTTTAAGLTSPVQGSASCEILAVVGRKTPEQSSVQCMDQSSSDTPNITEENERSPTGTLLQAHVPQRSDITKPIALPATCSGPSSLTVSCPVPNGFGLNTRRRHSSPFRRPSTESDKSTHQSSSAREDRKQCSEDGSVGQIVVKKSVAPVVSESSTGPSGKEVFETNSKISQTSEHVGKTDHVGFFPIPKTSETTENAVPDVESVVLWESLKSTTDETLEAGLVMPDVSESREGKSVEEITPDTSKSSQQTLELCKTSETPVKLSAERLLDEVFANCFAEELSPIPEYSEIPGPPCKICNCKQQKLVENQMQCKSTVPNGRKGRKQKHRQKKAILNENRSVSGNPSNQPILDLSALSREAALYAAKNMPLNITSTNQNICSPMSVSHMSASTNQKMGNNFQVMLPARRISHLTSRKHQDPVHGDGVSLSSANQRTDVSSQVIPSAIGHVSHRMNMKCLPSYSHSGTGKTVLSDNLMTASNRQVTGPTLSHPSKLKPGRFVKGAGMCLQSANQKAGIILQASLSDAVEKAKRQMLMRTDEQSSGTSRESSVDPQTPALAARADSTCGLMGEDVYRQSEEEGAVLQSTQPQQTQPTPQPQPVQPSLHPQLTQPQPHPKPQLQLTHPSIQPHSKSQPCGQGRKRKLEDGTPDVNVGAHQKTKTRRATASDKSSALAQKIEDAVSDYHCKLENVESAIVRLQQIDRLSTCWLPVLHSVIMLVKSENWRLQTEILQAYDKGDDLSNVAFADSSKLHFLHLLLRLRELDKGCERVAMTRTLWAAIFSPEGAEVTSTNQRAALCWLFVGLCRYEGRSEEVRAMAYHLVLQNGNDVVTLLLSIAAAWPMALTRKSVTDSTGAVVVMEHIVMTKISSNPALTKLGECLRCLCKWETTTLDSLSLLVMHIKELQAVVERTHSSSSNQAYELTCCIRMLCTINNSMWVVKNFLERAVRSAMSKWKGKGESDISPFYVAIICRLVGDVVGEDLQGKNKVLTQLFHVHCRGLLTGQHKHPAVDAACVDMMLRLAPLKPQTVFDVLHDWKMAATQGYIPYQLTDRIVTVRSCIQARTPPSARPSPFD